MSQIEVTYIDHMGSDLSCVNAARVSFDKESRWEGASHPDFDPDKRLSKRDAELIYYLAKHGHWSPFAHTAITLRIKAPIFVARQLAKHQVGFVWNEVSRRYVDSEPEIYIPDVWRGKSADKKQGLIVLLTHLAESWGGKDNGIGLGECCHETPITVSRYSLVCSKLDNADVVV